MMEPSAWRHRLVPGSEGARSGPMLVRISGPYLLRSDSFGNGSTFGAFKRTDGQHGKQ
jgi:hypothetical protein